MKVRRFREFLPAVKHGWETAAAVKQGEEPFWLFIQLQSDDGEQVAFVL